MIYLTSKARRFIDQAVRRSKNPDHQRVWLSWAASHPEAGTDQPQSELTPETASVALNALRVFEQFLESRIQSGRDNEDTLAEMDNDLSFIEAIERDLASDFGERHTS